MYGVIAELPALDPFRLEIKFLFAKGTADLSPACLRRFQSQNKKPTKPRKAIAPSTPPTIAGMFTLETSLGSNGVYLQYDQLLSAMCRGRSEYTRFWTTSVDLPAAASCEVPLCCTTIVCFFFWSPVFLKSAVHDAISLNESNPVC